MKASAVGPAKYTDAERRSNRADTLENFRVREMMIGIAPDRRIGRDKNHFLALLVGQVLVFTTW